MYDCNVFAVLTASDSKNKASSAFHLRENAQWLHKATGGVADEPTIDSREPTPAAEVPSADQGPDIADRLVLTFDKLKDLPNGVQFGTNPLLSHILLGHRGTRGISARQYNITVDDDLCIWLHDYYSTHGTAVSTNQQNEKELRRKDTWILARKPGFPSPFGDTIIHSGGLAVKITFPNHEAGNSRYVENLRALVNESKAAAPPVGGLGLDSNSVTATPSQAQTPSERAVYFEEGIVGKGAFGEVHRAIRMRDGEYVAIKKFGPPANKRRRDVEEPAWKETIQREFAIMRDNPHPNVIRVIEFREIPSPLIVMEYYDDGNIEEAGVTKDQYVTAIGQILDGITHLHAKGVVHRDLKPENFLIKNQPFFKVIISDFGLSKVVRENSLLTSFCGTFKYIAPEVFPGNNSGYGREADVWALGVIGLEWLYGIPYPPKMPTPRRKGGEVQAYQWRMWISSWANCLLNKLLDEKDNPVLEMLSGMMEISPKKRWPAERCLRKGLESGLFKRRVADNLVVNALEDTTAVERDDRSKTPTAALSTQAGIDPETTVVPGSLRGRQGAANLPESFEADRHPLPLTGWEKRPASCPSWPGLTLSKGPRAS